MDKKIFLLLWYLYKILQRKTWTVKSCGTPTLKYFCAGISLPALMTGSSSWSAENLLVSPTACLSSPGHLLTTAGAAKCLETTVATGDRSIGPSKRRGWEKSSFLFSLCSSSTIFVKSILKLLNKTLPR